MALTPGHLTGIDAPPTDPASFEHFGISIVESMLAGLIPVVLRTGGGRESVEGGLGDSVGATVSDVATLVRTT